MIVQRAGFVTTRSASPLLRHQKLAIQKHPFSRLSFQQEHRRRSSAMTFHSSSTSLGSLPSALPEIIAPLVHHPVKTIVPVVGVLSLFAFLKYRGAIRQRLKQVKEESWIFGAGVTMERGTDKETGKMMSSGSFQNLRLLELNPEFRDKYEKPDWSFVSMGDYMSSLRPKRLPKNFSVDDLPNVIQREIEAGLATALLKTLGPNLGRALLPAVGIGPIQSKAQGLASSLATKWFMSEEGSISESEDKGGIPVSLMTLLAISDVNAKVNGGKLAGGVADSVPNMGLSAIDKMKVGEIVKGPTFADIDIPAQFVISRDFDDIIRKMEERLGSTKTDDYELGSTELKMAQEEVQDQDKKETIKAVEYDPEDRRMADPVPINPRLFPDLHLGWGDALCSHTKREVLKMRLLSLILNKLGANYYRIANGDGDLFTVQMSEDDKPITTPWEFVKALMDSGHHIEAVPSSRLTTFGVAMCVKEKDGSFSNIPLGVFLESGYEDKDGLMAPAMMPHSGLDMHISGPLAGERADGTKSQLKLQHFVGVEGFCGWHSHDNAEVPFNEAVESGARLKGDDAVRATRIAGLYANVLNGLATEMDLPFGGYGLTAVCNDSAALVQQCMYNESTIYPMTSIGRFMQRTMRYAQRFRDQLSRKDGMEEETKDLMAITDAMKKIPSDLNAAPSNASSAARRMLHTLQPKRPFLLMNDSKRVMESILLEEQADRLKVDQITEATASR